MKKFLGALFALFTCFSLASCADNNEDTDAVMSYDEFMAVEVGGDVCVRGFIADKQGWWDNKVTCYLTTETAGEGYFVYEMPCTEEENNTKYTIGTYVQITSKKAVYANEHEVDGKSITEIKVIETDKKQATTPFDITNKLDNLFEHQNCYFTATLDVKEISFEDEKAQKDIYVKLTNGTKDVNFCVESYFRGPSTDTYKKVASLKDKIGTSVTITGYLYWWSNAEDMNDVKLNGCNGHIADITINE